MGLGHRAQGKGAWVRQAGPATPGSWAPHGERPPLRQRKQVMWFSSHLELDCCICRAGTQPKWATEDGGRMGYRGGPREGLRGPDREVGLGMEMQWVLGEEREELGVSRRCSRAPWLAGSPTAICRGRELNKH